MNTTILVAGGTGNLGGRIIKALLQRGARVRAVVRNESDRTKVNALVQQGVEVSRLDIADAAALTQACQGVACVVSALAGLSEVIVE